MGQKNFFKWKLAVLFVDVFLLVGSFTVVYTLRLHQSAQNLYNAPGFWFALATTLVSLYILGAYDFGSKKGSWYHPFRVFVAVLTGVLVVIAVHYIAAKDRSGFFGRGIFIGGSFLYLGLATILRLFVDIALTRKSQSDEWVFIVSEDIKDLIEKDMRRLSFLGKTQFLTSKKAEDVVSSLASRQSGIVVGAKEIKSISGLPNQLVQAKFAGHLVVDLAYFYEKNWQKIPYFYIDEEWIVSSEGFGLISSKVSLRIKRLADLAGALFLIVLTWPLMLLTALLVKLESKGPAIFRQTRTGLNGESFEIYKFRSMRADAEKDGAQWAQKNDNRVTRIGSFIRKTRLDELPQLFNILRGDMSFVGPRPERPEFNQVLEKEIPFYNLRHLVPPGLTGWAQINYSYGASVEDAKEKLSYELYYIKNHSLFLDLSIVMKTIKTVLFGKGR